MAALTTFGARAVLEHLPAIGAVYRLLAVGSERDGPIALWPQRVQHFHVDQNEPYGLVAGVLGCHARVLLR